MVVAGVLRRQLERELVVANTAAPVGYVGDKLPDSDDEGAARTAGATDSPAEPRSTISKRQVKRNNTRLTTAEKNRRARHERELRSIAAAKSRRRHLDELDRCVPVAARTDHTCVLLLCYRSLLLSLGCTRLRASVSVKRCCCCPVFLLQRQVDCKGDCGSRSRARGCTPGQGGTAGTGGEGAPCCHRRTVRHCVCMSVCM
jgi:hypothetical protein